MKHVKSFALFVLIVTGSVGARGSESLLRGLVGVGVQIRPLNLQSDSFDLSTSRLEEYVIRRMQELGIPLRSHREAQELAGKPFLELVANITHAQGPSHIYAISLELKEMAELQRPKDSVVVMAVGTWKRESIGIANRPEAILETVDRLLRLFSKELQEENVSK